MPVFVEDPSHLSKARLKSDLIAHNVALPPAKSKKGIYVELHTRHVDQRKCADFSSDDEPEEVDVEEPQDPQIIDPSCLTDDDLKAALLQHGVKAGPIVASTRALYERKLRTVLLSNGRDQVSDKVNGADEAVLYSDSEEEEESEEEQDQPVTEEVQTQTEPADQSQQDKQETAPEPVQENFKDLLAETPTGIYASRRRPIKGAAGRPVQYAFPKSP
ncbi:hypothetical protein WMY93_011566 [Mugilogobius chulae]|uniref:LEM domain-containing protein n=1 Tax=Mugilogobius chulae TaxID=88201 RepID=A0AAW0P373_9GOBI